MSCGTLGALRKANIVNRIDVASLPHGQQATLTTCSRKVHISDRSDEPLPVVLSSCHRYRATQDFPGWKCL